MKSRGGFELVKWFLLGILIGVPVIALNYLLATIVQYLWNQLLSPIGLPQIGLFPAWMIVVAVFVVAIAGPGEK